jgi:hypothetical protein
MTTWHRGEPLCPAWCTDSDHLGEILKLGQDYWHRGHVIEIPGTEETSNCDLIPVRVYLAQRVHGDERGWCRFRAEVVVESPGGLLPAAARQLAALVVELAAVADAAEDDMSQDHR